MDHESRVTLAFALAVAAAVLPPLAALVGWRVGPFRRLRAGDAAAGRLRGRWLLVALGVLPPLGYGAALVVDLVLSNASGEYEIAPSDLLSPWLLAVAGPWVLAGFAVGGRLSRTADPDQPLTTRERVLLAVVSGLSAWSVYGPLTYVAAFGIGLGMSDADSSVMMAAIQRTHVGAGIGGAVAFVPAVVTAWRARRPLATGTAMSTVPIAAAVSWTAIAWLG